ncbi:hypothetical protein L7F22_017962 [Adiantum nelumboides]|nr:hypothetical protein [Adiantum nelumboides]
MARGVLFRQSSGAAAAACSSGSNSKAQEAEDEEQKEVELLYLAHQGRVASVEALLSEGFIPVNFADFDGRTALHIAACEGHLDLIRLLILKRADVNARDRWGSTVVPSFFS